MLTQVFRQNFLYTAVVNDLPAEMAAGRGRFPPANEMRPLYAALVEDRAKLRLLGPII